MNHKRNTVAATILFLLVAVGGLLWLRQSGAATFVAQTEAESGARAGNAGPGSAGGASGDASVRFGTGAPVANAKIYGADGVVGYGAAAQARQLLGVNGTRDCHDEVNIEDANGGLPALASNGMWLTLCAGNYEGLSALDKHRQDYANTMAVLAAKYGPGGTYWADKPAQSQYAVRSFTTMNEPYGWWYRGGDNDPAAYARIARDAIAAGRAANPRAKFYIALREADVKLADGRWINWNDELLKAVPDLLSLADGYEVHVYDTPATVGAALDKIKDYAWSHGGNGKPLILTETNLQDGTAFPEQDYVTAMPQFVQMAQARPWLQETFIFTMHGYGSLDYLGFIAADDSVRQARSDAYKAAVTAVLGN